MKKWEAHVWRFTFMGKSKAGNWYEGQFRWFWTAYIAARWMALMCDLATPRKIWVKDAIMTLDGYKDELQDSPYGIRWGIKKL